MGTILRVLIGFIVWFFVRYGLGGFYTIGPSERAVLGTFGRAQRLGSQTMLEDAVSTGLRLDERSRYAYPQVRVITPGFYWKFPWQDVHRASVATATASIAFDPEDPSSSGTGASSTCGRRSNAAMRARNKRESTEISRAED